MLQSHCKIHGVTSQKSVTSGHHPEYPQCHREDLEDSSSLGFNAVSMGKWFPSFWRILVPSKHWELLTHWQITFHNTWMIGNITKRTSNLARKTLSSQNMKVELFGQESPPLYPDHIKSFAFRLYFKKFYYVSPRRVWGGFFIFHPGMDTSLLTCSGHMTFSKAHQNGHYCCVAYGREDAVM